MIPETDARVVINGERIQYWLSVGALPSVNVKVLIKKYGTNGTHLEQQKAALDRLAQNRRNRVAPPPPVAPKPAEEVAASPAAEAAPATEAAPSE